MNGRLGLMSMSALLAFTAAAGLVRPVAADPSGGSCQNVEIAVALAAGLPATASIAGTLCRPQAWAPGAHKIDVLAHGSTYDRRYWDWPVNPSLYSYVEDTLAAGRATFAYDRLAAGQSTTPPSALVTVTSDAYALHQVVQYLRGSYSEVNVIGHSFGSMVAVQEASTYHDIDRLVLTSMLHTLGPVFVNHPTSFYPALLDRQFIGLLDPGYLTTVPGARGTIFYNATADPTVIAYDEAHKDKASATQFADGMSMLQTPAALNVSQGVTAPVLIVVGDQDQLFCGLLLACNQAAVQAYEAPYYAHAASFDAVVVADTAHDLALHPSAPTTFATIDQWLASH